MKSSIVITAEDDARPSTRCVSCVIRREGCSSRIRSPPPYYQSMGVLDSGSFQSKVMDSINISRNEGGQPSFLYDLRFAVAGGIEPARGQNFIEYQAT